MDVGFKVEHVLRHLDHTEPGIVHWQKMAIADQQKSKAFS